MNLHQRFAALFPYQECVYTRQYGQTINMSRIADVLRTIANAIASVVRAIAHAIITIVTLPFRALAKLFRKR